MSSAQQYSFFRNVGRTSGNFVTFSYGINQNE